MEGDEVPQHEGASKNSLINSTSFLDFILLIAIIPITQCWKSSSEGKKVQPILLLDYDFGI